MVNKIILTSSNGESFEIDEVVACESQTIKHMIEDDCTSNGIPLHNVTGKTLAKVIEYCMKHVAEAKAGDKDICGFTDDDELRKWDAEFVNVDQSILFDIIMAANYLNIKGLLDLTCKTVAEMMKVKTPQQIRDLFNIKNDYTVEEEAQVVKGNAWVFE